MTSAGASASSTAIKFKPSKRPNSELVVVNVMSFSPRPISNKPFPVVAFTGMIAVFPKGIVTIGCSNEISSGTAIVIERSPTTSPS